MNGPGDNRITVLFPITDLSRDGAQHQLFELIKGMNKNKFRPIVLTLNSGGSMEPDFRQIPGLEIVSINKKGKYDLFCLFKVFNTICRLHVDVIQPFLTPATFFSLLPAIICRIPVIIVTERNAGGRKDVGIGYRSYLKMEDFLSRFADWAIPNSEAGKKYLIQRGINPKRVKVIYNGLNFQRLKTDNEEINHIKLKHNIPPQSQVVGMMARFYPMKNHAAFFEMAACVNRILPSTHFALLGDGPLRNDMESYNARMGLGSKTTFFGEQSDVGAYVSIFDVAVLTSSAEGCSNSILEAMALGKPVVATDVGGNREVINTGENGFLVPPGNTKAMADIIIQLLQNPDKVHALGQQARKFAITAFSIEKMVHEYESLYEETLSKKVNSNFRFSRKSQ